MGQLPQYLFVVRHGNRLDAADRKWHLSSPTPYDPPLTYGGFLQSRQVGNQIASILEQNKIESEVKASPSNQRRKRFKVVIHSSPFLRCVQTSVGISAGLAQTTSDSLYDPSDIIVTRPATGPVERDHFRPTVLRLDSFLGEWLSPEYFEHITPPPGPALMLGSAKADLLKRVDYSALSTVAAAPAPQVSGGSLWSASPRMNSSNSSQGELDGTTFHTSSMAAALSGQLEQRRGYQAPKPNYAISGTGKIPDGFVAHARDKCVAIDYQWDSTRPPLAFGDGGKLGEEWTAMHERFRAGAKSLVNWYATSESPAELVSANLGHSNALGLDEDYGDEDVETVVIMVSHGAGCNALIGAITHQPVLMDVGIASITMAARKTDVDYTKLAAVAQAAAPVTSGPGVPVDHLYEIRMSASTEHLQSTSSTPVSTRSSSTSNVWNGGTRGRTSTLGGAPGNVGPVMAPFIHHDSLSSVGNRSASATAALGNSFRRESAPGGILSRAAAMAAVSSRPSPPPLNEAIAESPVNTEPASGLWGRPSAPVPPAVAPTAPAPAPSSLRLLDEGSDNEDDFASLPSFGQSRFQTAVPAPSSKVENAFPPRDAVNPTTTSAAPTTILSSLSNQTPPQPPFVAPTPPSDSRPSSRPLLSAPIKLNTNFALGRMAEPINVDHLGDGAGGLWGPPRPPGEAERFRDLRSTKRRWTVNENARI